MMNVLRGKIFTTHLWMLSGIFLLLTGWGNPAWAGCSVTTTSTNFGVYWGNAPLLSTGTVSVSCIPLLSAPVTVYLDAGQFSLGSFVNRKMSSGNATLNYNLYTSATHTTVWGDGTGNSVIQQGKNLTVYGYMPASQSVAAGVYSDTIMVTAVW